MSNKRKDISYIQWHASRGVSWMHGRGYRWFKDDFYPRVLRLEAVASSRSDRATLSVAWYLIGDIHDFNEAPKAAIRAYRKSVQFNPGHGEAYRELGSMYTGMGKYRAAIRHCERAVALNPRDVYSVDGLNDARLELARDEAPLFKADDWSWQTRELLARRQFRKALRELEGRKSVLAMQYRACALAGLNKKDETLAEWRRIARAKRAIKLNWVDWYFITDVVFDEPDFWRSILDCRNRFWHRDGGFRYGTSWGFASLREIVFPRDESVGWESAAYRRRIERMHKAYTQYQLARTSKDVALARRLAKKYPNWPEAASLVPRLEGRTKVRISA